jgi:hypothetical protein
MQGGTGRSAWQTGLVILPYAIGSILTSGLGVALAAKAGPCAARHRMPCARRVPSPLWWLVRGGEDPGYWMLAVALFVGGLGLGLAAPILVNVVLAGVPGRDAGAAGGVLSTVNQIGGATGVAALGTVFFTILNRGRGSPDRLGVFSAFAAVLVWQVVLYVFAAGLMLLLPRAAAHQP